MTKINVWLTVKAKTLSSWIFENVHKEKDQKPEANEGKKKEKKNRKSKEKEKKKAMAALLAVMFTSLFLSF